MNTQELEVLIASKCLLCSEIENSADSLSSILGRKANHITYRGSNFTLLHDINPVISGHSLLVTNSHYNSFGQIPHSLKNDFLSFKRKIDSLFFNEYGAYFLFEHGTSILGSECRNCVSHAHIHYIPCSFSIEKYLKPYTDDLSKGNSVDTLSVLQLCHCEYLYYENHNKNYIFIRNPTHPIPRQFLRMIVANELSLYDWNWRSVLSDYVGRDSYVDY